jgi:hypothetical protein
MDNLTLRFLPPYKSGCMEAHASQQVMLCVRHPNKSYESLRAGLDAKAALELHTWLGNALGLPPAEATQMALADTINYAENLRHNSAAVVQRLQQRIEALESVIAGFLQHYESLRAKMKELNP